MFRHNLLLLCIALAFFGFTSGLSSSRALAQGVLLPATGSPGWVADEVVIRIRPDVDSSRDELVASVNGTVLQSGDDVRFDRIGLPPGASVEDALDRLREDPRIEWAEPNYIHRAFDLSCCPQDPDLRDAEGVAETQWGAFVTGLPTLWRTQGCSDSLVTIAIVDSGIDSVNAPHADLADNILPNGFDFVDGDDTPNDAGNNAGHGTHVAGIAAGVANDIGIAGVAPNSRLLIVRVLDCRDPDGCIGTATDIALGIEYATNQGARVINLSLGSGILSEVVRSAINYALENQAIVVAASGNDGVQSVSYPAAIPEVIAVGASNADDDVADFSNWGDELDIVAPGEAIWSTVPGGGWELKSGTSMAAPFVSGVAAILASRSPTIRPFEVQNWLRSHTVDIFGPEDGFGRIDFGTLEDWSDATAPFPEANHESHFWEWLGSDATAEISITDTEDMDGRPNVGGTHDSDGADDGMFPGSFEQLPFLPPHLTGEPTTVEVSLSVGAFDGPRYGPEWARSLHLDAWFDWNSDQTFTEDDTEHEIVDHVENPATWSANSTSIELEITPPDEHYKGNPLVVRTRLAYGETSGTPEGEVPFGEVEDVSFINYVEDFDISLHTVDVEPFMDPFGWFLRPDPDPDTGCTNHGEWELASVPHPNFINIPCDGGIESARGMHTPTMDWSEYTDARLRFFYCHDAEPCSPHPDLCRVVLFHCDEVVDLSPIPLGSGTAEFDLSEYAGCSSVTFLFIEETDWFGRLSIDDVVIWAWDDSEPEPIVDLAAGVQGPGEALLTWTSPKENRVEGPLLDEQANYVQLRYDSDPIENEEDWSRAALLRPQDVVAEAGLPVPGAPNESGSASFGMPSAFGTYHFAARVGDEVVSLSDVSDDDVVILDPSQDVRVVGQADTLANPGDLIAIGFEVENSGEIEDLFRIDVAGSQSWTLLPEHDYVTLEPGEALQTSVSVLVPSDAGDGEIDEVELTATSVGGGETAASDVVDVVVDGGTSGTVEVAGLGKPFVRVGVNPFAEEARFELGLNQSGRTQLRVHDVSGRLVREVLDTSLDAGKHTVVWDGRWNDGREAAAGIFFVTVRGPGLETRRRIVRVR